MEGMRNLALGSRLNATELKQIWETAKAKVAEMDFSLFEKKKRKQKWDELLELEKKQKKRDMRGDAGQMSSDAKGSDASEPEADESDFHGLFREETTEESYTLDESIRF